MTSLKLGKPRGSLGVRVLVERGRSGYGHRSISRVFENKLADFDRNLSNPKFPEKMGGEIVGQRFEKFGGVPGNKVFCFLTERGIIDRSRDCVLDVAKITRGPESNIKNEPLTPTAFGAQNADLREDFQLFDMDLLLGANPHFFPSPNILAANFLIENCS